MKTVKTPPLRQAAVRHTLLLLAATPALMNSGKSNAAELRSSVVASGSASQLQADSQPTVTFRVKDLARIEGVRSNQLVGFGIVVGLSGTGDSKSSLSTNKAVAHLLTRLGSLVSPDQVTTKNVAGVIVTADLPPFAQGGDRIPVRVSSVGDASSLAGGSLILTPLQGADGETYAVAQGNISLGSALAGASGGGRAADALFKTVALSDGGTVEREFPTTFLKNGQVHLSLKHPDFTTASRVATAINMELGEFLATALNSAQVVVNVPPDVFNNPSFQIVDYVAAIEQIAVKPDLRARLVINERTGTVIAGRDVRVLPVAISHGHLTIEVRKLPRLVGGIGGTTTIGELVESLNAMGTGPRDLVAIVQALERAGALNAEIIFM